MLLKALKDLPTAVNLIRAGDLFHETNEERANEWIVTGYAEVYRYPPNEPKPVNADLAWEGATVVILASGESLTLEQCAMVGLWQDNPFHRVIVINTTFRLAPWADLLYACDGKWWNAVDPTTNMKYAEEAAQHFNKDNMWTQDKGAADLYGLRYIKSLRKQGLSKVKGVIHQGANSGFQAINLAYLAGARRFILLGFDCKGNHWHGNHPGPINTGMPHGTWKKEFQILAADLEKEKVDVVNCSPGTALRAFRTGDLAEELLK